MKIKEILEKPLTAQQSRIRALKNTVKQAQTSLKAEKSRQQIASAQQRLQKLNAHKIAV